jgi:hypothetical protein
LLACLGVAAFAPDARAEQRGYLVRIVGRVVSVDQRDGKIVLHHGMLETANPADEPCLVPRNRLRFIRAGMDISALADTRHRPWKLIELRRFTDTISPPPSGSSVRLAVELPSEFQVKERADRTL